MEGVSRGEDYGSDRVRMEKSRIFEAGVDICSVRIKSVQEIKLVGLFESSLVVET